MAIPLSVKYFSGTSEDFDSLVKEIVVWLENVKLTNYQLNSTTHFNEQSQRWEILVTIMYKDNPASDIAVGRLVIPRQTD